MFFKQLATKESSLSYFLGCGTLGKSIAVDMVAGVAEASAVASMVATVATAVLAGIAAG